MTQRFSAAAVPATIHRPSGTAATLRACLGPRLRPIQAGGRAP